MGQYSQDQVRTQEEGHVRPGSHWFISHLFANLFCSRFLFAFNFAELKYCEILFFILKVYNYCGYTLQKMLPEEEHHSWNRLYSRAAASPNLFVFFVPSFNNMLSKNFSTFSGSLFFFFVAHSGHHTYNLLSSLSGCKPAGVMDYLVHGSTWCQYKQ